MNDTRDLYIGARFTVKEKEYIEKIAQKRDMSLSELLREAVFSHLKFLEELKSENDNIELVVIKQNKKNKEEFKPEKY